MPENELRTLLAEASADRPPGVRILPVAPRPRRMWLPVAAAAAAAATAVVLVLPGTTPSANAQVMAAVDTTSSESYRIETVSGAKTFTGAFDPERRVGVIVRNDGAETRFVGDTVYGKDPGDAKWFAGPRFDDELRQAPAAVGLVKLMPLDPPAALSRLRAATEVTEQGPASGDGWTGARFAFTLPDGVSGLVDVDDQDRIRRLEVTFAAENHTNVMEFGDFGTAVTVEAPPQDQITTEPGDKHAGGVPKPVGTASPVKP
ncbi:hypothetical protein GT755_24945 [Herbidospora sp. NEAU-GS84]|uniref:LppX_LprAFG lipoprotein n=1 Tax=Herbidospora solisilvae TaxID=2696284 RepID=A0A7C9J681_9ACTN|nr:hypothetical protein [Herbidospora solisilvae]NAS24920.1 hypothetical protein [Herbidospora solisilvae]